MSGSVQFLRPVESSKITVSATTSKKKSTLTKEIIKEKKFSSKSSSTASSSDDIKALDMKWSEGFAKL